MPRKTTRKKSSSRVKKSTTRSRLKKEVPAPKEIEKPVEIKKKAEPKAEYMGLSYETWINVTLIVAVILIIGILAGVGTLVQRTYQNTVPSIAPSTPSVPESYIKARAQKVLDTITRLDPNIDSVNITKVEEFHGVYRVNITFSYRGMERPGAIFISKDGSWAFLRGFQIDEFLNRYENATVVGTATINQ